MLTFDQKSKFSSYFVFFELYDINRILSMSLTTKIAETLRSIFFLRYFRAFQFAFDHLSSLFSRLKMTILFS